MAYKLRAYGHCLLLAMGCLAVLPAAETATEYNRYLAHLFRQYGNGGTMSFEGLEHLMYNLGLGQIEFEPTHTIAEHRPKGYNDAETESELKLKAYFEQQTVKLAMEDDVQVAQQQQQQQQQQQKRNGGVAPAPNEEPDVYAKDHAVQERGIVLEFKEMHDPMHRHPRENDDAFDAPPLSANVCLSPKSLLRLVVDHEDLHRRKLYKTVTPLGVHNSADEYNDFINHVKLTPMAFMKLCPALLAQIDQHVCVRPAPLVHAEDPKQLMWSAWIYASVSIFILSACGLLGILLVPLMKSAAYQEILKFLVAVAVGTLAGDALMHLLPHALAPEHGAPPAPTSTDAHAHSNEAVWICACAFVACVFMYILESLLPLLKGVNGHSHGHGHGHSHSHTHHNAAPTPPPASTKGDSDAPLPTPTLPPANADAKELNVMLNESKTDGKTGSRPLTPLAFMVVIGDGLHNLTDGLAIGAAFASDPVTGMATAFAVLCHELPHELGDFALLLQTGVALRRAVYLNIVSSVLSFVGMAVGLLIAGVHSNMTQWIYAATAGSFLYIALADLVPAMSDAGRRDLKACLIQIVGIVTGGIIMMLIAVNEEKLDELFK